MDSLGVGYIWDSQVGVGSSRQSWELLGVNSLGVGETFGSWNSQVGVGTLRWWELVSWEWKSGREWLGVDVGLATTQVLNGESWEWECCLQWVESFSHDSHARLPLSLSP